MTMRYHLKHAMTLLSWLLMLTGGQLSAAPTAYEATSSGYFRDTDTLPGIYQQYWQSPEYGGAIGGLGPGRGDIKRSSFRADAHDAAADYGVRSCVSCHEAQRYSLHTSRGRITCVQCHREQPISGVYQYYSEMNPIRRHAYVCAKCHEGASASFATYVIHEPPPLASSTAKRFPLFYYAVWFMAILAVGVFAIFVPYVILWGLRELVDILAGKKRHGNG